MNTQKQRVFHLSCVALATMHLCMPLSASADDEEANALKLPTQTLEIGGINSSVDSSKFGEFNGLQKSGTYLNGNVRLRGGAGYKNNEGGETRRWAIDGSDLGLTSRSLSGSVSEQGEWSWGASYDELRHNLTGGYQTVYEGTMGGNSFRLPSSIGYINSANPNTTANYNANTQTTNFTGSATNGLNWTTYLKDMQIYSGRKNATVTGNYILDSTSSLAFEYNQLKQDGAKLMALPTSKNGTVAAAEKIAILPSPTDYLTDTWNLAYHWKDDKSRFSASYFGSFFRDGYDRINYQPGFSTSSSTSALTQVISTAPNNSLNQLNLSGGYDFSRTRKLTGNFSWGKNTQNSPFAYDTSLQVTAPGVSSLNGLVDTTHLDLKLTDNTTKDLTLSSAIKYDLRDNRTTSNIYNFNAISGSNVYNYPNTPLSTRKTALEFSGDYRINSNQKMRMSYAHEDVQRWCNHFGSTASTTYPEGTNCVVARGSKEDKIDGSLRQKLTESADLKFAYTYSDRMTDSDIYAKTAMAGWSSGFTGPVNVNTGLAVGQNGGDFLGFYPYFNASRKQHALKLSSNWQANDQLSFGLSGRFTYDNYGDSTYGVQMGNSHSVNFDSTYTYSDSGSVFGYITQQDRRRDMVNRYQSITAGIAGNWFNTLQSSDVTYGFGFKEDGLMSGKLSLKGDVAYSLAKSYYATELYYTPATVCTDPGQLTCGATPTVRSAMTQVKLNGVYTLDKQSKISVTYVYQHLAADDYYYNGLQAGYTPTGVIPTNQQAGGYNVQAVGISYVYNY